MTLPTNYLFPTMVVGSLPRPVWIQELIEQRKTGEVSEKQAETLLDSAIPGAIRMQERAGLDFLSDGEWRRESYVKVFTEAVDGFTPDLISVGTSLAYPAVTGKLKRRQPIAARAAAFLKEQTQTRLNVSLPSPYTIARRMWSPEYSTAAYPHWEDFMEACIPILRKEIQELVKVGVHAVQLDDPWLALLVDPSYRRRERIKDVEHEIAMSVAGVNGATDGIDDAFLSVHLCHAHYNRRHGTRGPYNLIIDALGKMNVARFAMEFATPDAEGIDVLKDFPADKILGLGVIDHTDPHIETPAEIVARVEAVLEYLPQDRITLNTDCGFAPSSSNPMDFDEAYLKLQAMCQGAKLLRQKYS